jgi:hypothetical protein
MAGDHDPEERVGVEGPRLEAGGSELGFGGGQLEPDNVWGQKMPGGEWATGMQ